MSLKSKKSKRKDQNVGEDEIEAQITFVTRFLCTKQLIAIT